MDIAVDMAAWQRGLAGGLLIGLSAVLLLGLNGRIAGISGVLGGALDGPPVGDRLWRWLFVGGLLLGGLLYVALVGRPVLTTLPATLPVTILAGLLVGIGTRMGNGCTSGHGVCGLARLSPRSLVATAAFMGSAMVTVFVTSHLLGAV